MVLRILMDVLYLLFEHFIGTSYKENYHSNITKTHFHCYKQFPYYETMGHRQLEYLVGSVKFSHLLVKGTRQYISFSVDR